MKQFSTDTVDGILDILSHVKSAPSGIRMSSERDYRFEVCAAVGQDPSTNGFLIRCGFWRPDTNTGEMGEGFGRWNYVPRGSSVDAIVKTAYVAIKLVVEHEMMEAFEFMGVKAFNPHKTLEELAFPAELPTEVPLKPNETSDVLRHVTANLMAAISLLEAGGKKGAMSDRAFEVMLKDYKAAAKKGKMAHRRLTKGK